MLVGGIIEALLGDDKTRPDGDGGGYSQGQPDVSVVDVLATHV